MFGTKKAKTGNGKKQRDWTRAKAARETARADKVRWLVEHGFNERTSPAYFYEQYRDRGCPYTKAGLYRVRDTMFRGRTVSGEHNAGSVPVMPQEALLPAIREAVEQEGTMVIEPAPALFSLIINAGKWR